MRVDQVEDIMGKCSLISFTHRTYNKNCNFVYVNVL